MTELQAISEVAGIKTATGVEVIIENLWPKVCKMLSETEGDILQTKERKNYQWRSTCQSLFVLLYLKTKEVEVVTPFL